VHPRQKTSFSTATETNSADRAQSRFLNHASNSLQDRAAREDRTMTTEDLQHLLPGLPTLLGLTIKRAEKDLVVAELLVRPELCTVGDTIHGGTIMAFADTVGAIGTVMNLAAGQGTTTIESKTNFFAGAKVGTLLTAESVPLHRGRRTQVWETRITNRDGRLIAKVTQTQMVL
jgi:uncharacterized protein (TIGR00369 family)